MDGEEEEQCIVLQDSVKLCDTNSLYAFDAKHHLEHQQQKQKLCTFENSAAAKHGSRQTFEYAPTTFATVVVDLLEQSSF